MLAEIVDRLNVLVSEHVWITQVFIVVFLVLFTNLVLRRLLRRLEVKLEKTTNPWDDALLYAVRKPLGVLVWIVGLAFAAQLTGPEAETIISEFVEPVRDVLVIATIIWFLVRLIKSLEETFIRRHQDDEADVDRTTIEAIGKLARASVIITGTLVLMQTLGYSVTGVLAFGGIGGIAIGFAAKDLLANFFGSLMIYMDRPFAVGDWIRSPDREIEGTVEQIGWRLTIIRTFDQRPLYVPNSVFTSIAVQNPSRMHNRRIYETIGLRYQDAAKMADITRDVKQMLVDHPAVDTSKIIMVNFNSFGPSSLDFFVYVMTRTTNWAEYHGVKQDVLLRIFEVIASHGADIAFPTRTVLMPEGMPPQDMPLSSGHAPAPIDADQ